MIGLYDFMAMDDNQKGLTVFSTPCLGDRQENGEFVQLYRIDEFYVEVFYDPAANRITRFRPFKNNVLLVPYINISSVFIK